MKKCAVSGFSASRAMILMSRSGVAVKNRKLSKIPNWKHYLLETLARRKKNWQNRCAWRNASFRNASKPWDRFRRKEIGFRTCWSRETSILQHANGWFNVAKPVKIHLKTLKWEVFPPPAYSPDIPPSDCHLFRSMAHGLAYQHFRSYEKVKMDRFVDSFKRRIFSRWYLTISRKMEKSSD